MARSAAGGEGQTEATGHQPTVELAEAFPPEVEAGAEIVVRARVSCPEGCDLRGGLVNIVSSEEVVLTGELGGSASAETAETIETAETAEPAETAVPAESAGTAETTDLVLNAPAHVGEKVWSITFPRQEVGGVVHEECVLAVTSNILPHTTSVAIWGVPSPVKDSGFGVTVGIKCSAGCSLAGQLVEVWDEAGVKLGDGILGDDPRPGTSALYDAEVSLVAPSQAGVFSRSASFAPTELDLPHLEATGDFTFRSLEPPEHTVTVQIVPNGLETPLDNIEVRLGAYQAETDERGLATVGVPKGTYELSALRIDIEPVSTELEVTGDAMVEVEATPRQVVDEDEERMWM